MAHHRGRKRFHKKRKRREDPSGLAVTVYNNNVEGALKILKRKIKNSNLMVELRKRTYYEKPSKLKREQKNLAILRQRYKDQKEKESTYKLSQLIGDRLSLFNFYHPKRIHDTMLSWIDSGINVIPMQPAADHFVYYPDYPDEKLECDISFVGGYWSYKGQNLSKYLFPLTNPVGKYRMKVFGTGWGIPQYCGVTDDDTVRKLFCSSKICPNVSEPHANKFGFEVNERVFKISACKSFCISDHIDSLVEDVFTKNEMPVARNENEFINMIKYFIDSPNLRKSHAEACYETVMKEHTYCHRINSLLRHLQYKEEAEKCLEILNGNK